MSNQVYDDSSIDLLLGAERIRRRPASMLGSSGLDGSRHGFIELYGNALDEKSSGFGDRLEVIHHEDGSISIRDYGRGVPLGWNSAKNNWNWHIIYNELYGGGKYNDNQEALKRITDWSKFDEKAFNYLFSERLNGLGAASTQYTSEFFIVKSYRDGKCTTVEYKKGYPLINGVKVNMFDGSFDLQSYVPNIEDTDEANGTYIHWKPDSDVFSDINVGGGWLFSICEDIADIANIDLHFEDRQTGIVKDIKAGDLENLIINKCGKELITDEDNNPILLRSNDFSHGTITVEGKPFIYVCKADVAIAFTKERVEHHCYHNSVFMKSGAQYDGIMMALDSFFKKIASEKGLKLDARDYESVINVAVSSYSNYASVRNQTKDMVEDSFIRDIVYKTVLMKLNTEYGKGNKELLSAISRVVIEAEARIASKLAYETTKKVGKINKQKDPDKFHTCKAYMHKDYSITELWITEGDSAQGAVDKARNSDFQATFPIRGKCLNVLKSSLEKILANEEIKGIFSLLGTGMDIGHNLFDISKLKFNKIIFATDADEDGFQIRVLLFLIFYKLAPQLIKEGHVFIAETPRFEIKLNDGTALYARDDKERDEIIKNNAGKVRGIARFKGLGEVDKQVLRKTTVHPDSRNLIPVTVDFEDEFTRDMIDALFGNDKYHQRKSILTTMLGEDVAGLFDDNFKLMQEIEDSDIETGVEYIEV